MAAARLGPAFAREHTQQLARFKRAEKSLSEIANRQISNWQSQITAAERLRRTLGYEATLERGFAVVRGAGTVITNTKDATQQPALEIQFADGKIIVRP